MLKECVGRFDYTAYGIGSPLDSYITLHYTLHSPPVLDCWLAYLTDYTVVEERHIYPYLTSKRIDDWVGYTKIQLWIVFSIMSQEWIIDIIGENEK